MAVVANADPVDVALDLIASTRDERDRGSIDVALAAASIAALWQLVAGHALSRGDSDLLAIAAAEWQHARAAFGAFPP